MTLLEVCEVREFGMLKQPTSNVRDSKKVNHRSPAIAAHMHESTPAPGREEGIRRPGRLRWLAGRIDQPGPLLLVEVIRQTGADPGPTLDEHFVLAANQFLDASS